MVKKNQNIVNVVCERSLRLCENRIYKDKKRQLFFDNFLQILAIRVLLLLSLVVGVAQLGQSKYFKEVAFKSFISTGIFFKSPPVKRINVENI